MTDERDKGHPGDHDIPLAPFPAWSGESPFPPLHESLGGGDPPSDWMQGADAHDLPTRESRLARLGRFAFPPAPPLDDEGVAARDRRWASRSLGVAVLFLLVFNAVSPLNWARQQPPGWVQATVEKVSTAWVDQLALIGTDEPRRGLRDAWTAAQDARFVGQPPAPAR